MGIKFKSLTVRKSFNFNTVEATVEVEGVQGDYESASALLQHITNEELKKTLKEVKGLSESVTTPTPSAPKPTYNGGSKFPARKLSEGQKKFAHVLIKQGKLPQNFDMDGADAYEQFRTAAGDRDDYKTGSR